MNYKIKAPYRLALLRPIELDLWPLSDDPDMHRYIEDMAFVIIDGVGCDDDGDRLWLDLNDIIHLIEMDIKHG